MLNQSALNYYGKPDSGMARREIYALKYLQKFGLSFPAQENLLGHEELVAKEILFPILSQLGYTDTVFPKPEFHHEIVGKRREVDYGIHPYETVALKCGWTRLYGMVADVKKYKEPLTSRMEEKLAGYCALAGALYGLLTNGEIIIVVKPVRGAVTWENLNEIPSHSRLINELKGYPNYSHSDVIYANRVLNVPDVLDEKSIEKVAIDCHNIIRRRSGMQVPERLYESSKLFLLRILDEKEYYEGDSKDLNITYENIKELQRKKVDIQGFINKRFHGSHHEAFGIGAVSSCLLALRYPMRYHASGLTLNKSRI